MIFPVVPVRGIGMPHLVPIQQLSKLHCLQKMRISKLIPLFYFPRLSTPWTKWRKAAFDTFLFLFFFLFFFQIQKSKNIFKQRLQISFIILSDILHSCSPTPAKTRFWERQKHWKHSSSH